MAYLACKLLGSVRGASHVAPTPSSLAAACSSLLSSSWSHRSPSNLSTSGLSTSADVGYLDLALPFRKGKFAELGLVNIMLPNRQAFAPHFSPHGVGLLPRIALQSWALQSSADPESASLQSQWEATRAAAAGGGSSSSLDFDQLDLQHLELAAALSDGEDVDDALHAISIRTWRRLKMRKHKIDRRRKANRHTNKK